MIGNSQGPQVRTDRKARAPKGFVPLAQRASELGLKVASLRRQVHLGGITGEFVKIGNRIYVSSSLSLKEANPRTRNASVVRETSESRVAVTIALDGTGRYDLSTGNGMLDHLLAQLSRHGLVDLRVQAEGDTSTGWHHLVEDVAITLGRALHQAVGDGRGIVRAGYAAVPLDEALAQVAVDLSGRGYAVVDTSLEASDLEQLPGDLVKHFLESLALEGKFTLHATVVRGADGHHKAEALFKALARALRQAVKVDEAAGGGVPSTKGTVQG